MRSRGKATCPKTSQCAELACTSALRRLRRDRTGPNMVRSDFITVSVRAGNIGSSHRSEGTMRVRSVVLMTMLAGLGCAWQGTPVPVTGELVGLTGEWEGTYSSV